MPITAKNPLPIQQKLCTCRVEGKFAFIQPAGAYHESLITPQLARNKAPDTGGHGKRSQGVE